jgi:hypothetical protein
MIWWLFCLACEISDSVSWSEESRQDAVLARLDHDKSGGVSPEEFKKHAWKAPKFRWIDQDRDKQLSSEELNSLLYSQDVQRFDGGKERRPVDKDEWSQPFAQPRNIRQIWELLSFLDQELLAASAGSVRPTFAERDTASKTGSLDSPEVLSVLDQYRQTFLAADLRWPEGLINLEEIQ